MERDQIESLTGIDFNKAKHNFACSSDNDQ